MSITYTTNTGLSIQSTGSTAWSGPLNQNFSELDAITAIGGMAVQQTEYPSTTLNIAIAPGYFINNQGILTSYAGVASQAMTAVNTNYLYLNSAGALQLSTSAFPSSPTIFVPIATVVAGASTITSIADSRCNLVSIGGFLGTAGGTMVDGSTMSVGVTSGLTIGGSGQQLKIGDGTISALGITSGWQIGTTTNQILTLDAALTLTDGVSMALGTTAGLKIGTATSQRLAFYGKSPIVQSVMTSAFASSTFSSTEQSMLNTVYSVLRNLGLGS